MPTSHYFPLDFQNNNSETSLIQDLVDEQIKLFGADVIYLPRQNITDGVLDEIIHSEFNRHITFEVMLQNVQGFGDNSEFISKFGLKITDEIKIIVSKRRWEDEVYKLQDAIKIRERPNEGDLIYFPLTENLYEIKYVEREAPFYQLGKIYFYTMTCEIYDVGNDVFDTTITEVNNVELENDYSIAITLAEGGSGDYIKGDVIEYHSVSDDGNGGFIFVPLGIKATVGDWYAPTRTLKLINVTGDFAAGQAVLKENGSTYQSDGVWIIDTQDPTVNIDNGNNEYDDNKYIEQAADDILDFTERNPFGEYGNFTDPF
jgi:hypothetical protein